MTPRKTRIVQFIATLVLLCSGATLQAQQQENSPLYLQVMETLESLTPGDTLDVKMGSNKERYAVGDPFELRFKTDRDCYFLLMDLSTNGDITFIVPSHQVADQRLEGERVYSTLEDFQLHITVTPPAGVETLNLFCSPEPLDLFEADFTSEPFYTITPDDELRLKDLLTRLMRLEQQEWSGTSVSIYIGPQLRAIPRRRGALPPIGTTGTAGKFFPPIGTTGTAGKSDNK